MTPSVRLVEIDVQSGKTKGVTEELVMPTDSFLGLVAADQTGIQAVVKDMEGKYTICSHASLKIERAEVKVEEGNDLFVVQDREANKRYILEGKYDSMNGCLISETITIKEL